jgi:hypothetical protein
MWTLITSKIHGEATSYEAPHYAVYSSLPPFPPSPNILMGTLFSNTINLRNCLSVRVDVSRLYKTTGEIMGLYILISKFLWRRGENYRP